MKDTNVEVEAQDEIQEDTTSMEEKLEDAETIAEESAEVEA